MKLTRFAFTALFFVGAIFAQGPFGGEQPDDGTHVPEALISEIGLDEAQIDQLRANNQSLREQVRPLTQDAAEKRRQLRGEMRNDPPNPTVIGQLTMELEAIQAQVQTVRATFQESARAVLTQDQVDALGPIEDALALAQASRQAVALNLVSSPEDGGRPNAGPRNNRRGGSGDRGPRRGGRQAPDQN